MKKDDTPKSRFLMGNEAIGRGIIEAGCSVAAAYPGTPSSEVMESLVRWKKELDYPIYLEWSINEKVAFETAYGASLAGVRSMAAMKMVGLNVASDPFLSAAYLGVRAGLVVVVADDPGPHSSQTEQDTRFFAWFAKVPVLDPGTPSEAKEMVVRAFELSEKYRVPVLLRPCLRVCHARQDVALSDVSAACDVGSFEKDWTRWAAIPRYRFVLHQELNQKLSAMRQDEPESRPYRAFGDSGDGLAIITSGSVSSHVRDIISSDTSFDGVNVFKVDMPFPANGPSLQEIVDHHRHVLVVEETYPVLELQLTDRRKVMGRLSGHVPEQGELTPEIVEDLISDALGRNKPSRPTASVKARRPTLCSGCPHRPTFLLIRTVFDKAVYTGDIGCYTLGINMGAVDTCLCMGASIGMAGGFSQAPLTREKDLVVATIGDSTFFHSGVPALINAVHTKSPLVLVIMDNMTTAMTGGQPTPAQGFLADGAPAVPIDMERLVKGCGVDFLEVVDPYDLDGLRDSLQKAKDYTYEDGRGVSVIIARRPCVQSLSVKLPLERFAVGPECDRCMTCIRDLQCPAISFSREEKRAKIDVDQCFGCGVCRQICPANAIEPLGAQA